MLRPPSTPRPLAPLPKHRTTGGAAPGPVRTRRHGAPLWSPPTSPRRSRSPSTRRRRPSGSPTPGRGPTRPRASSASCRPTSAFPTEDRAAYGGSAGRRLDPPEAGPEAFPQRFVAPQARAGSDPELRESCIMLFNINDLRGFYGSPEGRNDVPPLCRMALTDGLPSCVRQVCVRPPLAGGADRRSALQAVPVIGQNFILTATGRRSEFQAGTPSSGTKVSLLPAFTRPSLRADSRRGNQPS